MQNKFFLSQLESCWTLSSSIKTWLPFKVLKFACCIEVFLCFSFILFCIMFWFLPILYAQSIKVCLMLVDNNNTVLGGCPFHGRVERDEIPTRESPPKQSRTLPCPALPFPPLPSPPLPSPPLHSPPLHSLPSAACCCPSQCTPFVRLAS